MNELHPRYLYKITRNVDLPEDLINRSHLWRTLRTEIMNSTPNSWNEIDLSQNDFETREAATRATESLRGASYAALANMKSEGRIAKDARMITRKNVDGKTVKFWYRIELPNP